MGVWSSREEREGEAEQPRDLAPSSSYRFPPKTGGRFFGSHFVLGGERFESPQPEAFLFGDNGDLNFIGRRPVVCPYLLPTPDQPCRTLRALVNIRRDSVRLIRCRASSGDYDDDDDDDVGVRDGSNPAPAGSCEDEGSAGAIDSGSASEGSPSAVRRSTVPAVSRRHQPPLSAYRRRRRHPSYRLQFTFDCDVPCLISVHYVCTEELGRQGLVYRSRRPSLSSRTYRFAAGVGQKFAPVDHVLWPSQLVAVCGNGVPAEAGVCAGGDWNLYPVVIECRADSGRPPRQCHVTLGFVEHTVASDSCSSGTGGYHLKPLKQKLYADGLVYLLQEVYGIENKRSELAAPAADSSAVCASELPHPEQNSADGGDTAAAANTVSACAASTAVTDSTSLPAVISAADSDETGAECVICMSELRDTLILPCRHLCVCSGCAGHLRYQANNCPICRAAFRALLQLRAVQTDTEPRSVDVCDRPAAGAGEDVMSGGDSPPPPIPVGYRLISLIEALNGPLPTPPSTPPPFSCIRDSLTVASGTSYDSTALRRALMRAQLSMVSDGDDDSVDRSAGEMLPPSSSIRIVATSPASVGMAASDASSMAEPDAAVVPVTRSRTPSREKARQQQLLASDGRRCSVSSDDGTATSVAASEVGQSHLITVIPVSHGCAVTPLDAAFHGDTRAQRPAEMRSKVDTGTVDVSGEG